MRVTSTCSAKIMGWEGCQHDAYHEDHHDPIWCWPHKGGSMKCSHKCFCCGPVFQHTSEIIPLFVLIQYGGPRSIPNGNSSTNSRCIVYQTLYLTSWLGKPPGGAPTPVEISPRCPGRIVARLGNCGASALMTVELQKKSDTTVDGRNPAPVDM